MATTTAPRAVDLRRDLYKASDETVSTVSVPTQMIYAIDSEGKPELSSSFHDATRALRSLTFTTRFALKQEGKDTGGQMRPLEGLWWADGGSLEEAGPDNGIILRKARRLVRHPWVLYRRQSQIDGTGVPADGDSAPTSHLSWRPGRAGTRSGRRGLSWR